jgi:hypothetical protein
MPTMKISNLNLSKWKPGQKYTLTGKLISQNLAVFDKIFTNIQNSEDKILHEISVYAEKCRHIPALDFKSMWLHQWSRISNVSNHKNMSIFDLISTKTMLKIEKSKIIISSFTLMPNMNFEFYKVKPVLIRNDDFEISSLEGDFGYLSCSRNASVALMHNNTDPGKSWNFHSK